jgi:hypothetical protein
MPITPFLNGERFDPEATRVLGVALEMVCIALRIGDCDDDIKQAIATKLIALAKTGERNPDLLCEETLKEIRRPHSGPLRKLCGLRSWPIQSRIGKEPGTPPCSPVAGFSFGPRRTRDLS